MTITNVKYNTVLGFLLLFLQLVQKNRLRLRCPSLRALIQLLGHQRFYSPGISCGT